MTETELIEECKAYCFDTYVEAVNHYLANHPRGPIAKRSRDARRTAIIDTAILAREAFSELSPSVIWRLVQKAHVKTFVNVDIDIEPETIDKILSARQSWVKSSGHAFEEMVKKECNEALTETNIVVLLQRDLTPLIEDGLVSNLEMDIDWLREECSHDVFDLFVARKEDLGRFKVFGCIQAKTSIRDRVTRDREPSIRAMQKKFWSLLFIFDDQFLQMPKFVSMVNGGTQEFPNNGWHFAYNYGDFHEGRIKSLRQGMSTFVDDALNAEEAFNGENRAFVTPSYPLH